MNEKCEFQLAEDDKRKGILEAKGNLAIVGGPGSGKTTIALFKAKQIIENEELKGEQKVLFLSFARVTISRVEEQAGKLIPKELKKQIEITTYHSFIWNVLKHHGYLISNKPIQLLPPHEAASRLSGVDRSELSKAENELFINEGLVHFDLFAKLCAELFAKSLPLKRIISLMYPVIILDEFQDTNEEEWELINSLGDYSRLIVLADPDQRIYDFRGASPKRIPQFIERYSPKVFDFGKENNRSNGTDIVEYGNDLLSKSNKGKKYSDVEIEHYNILDKQYKHLYLKIEIFKSIKRLDDQGLKKWSIAVLVPSNALMIEVSDFLQKKQQLPNGNVLPLIQHDVAIETAGPSLAALLIATLLDFGSSSAISKEKILNAMKDYILGRKGNKAVPKKDLDFVKGIDDYLRTGSVRGKNRKGFISECNTLSENVNSYIFSGRIINDWKQMVTLISECKSDYFKKLVEDTRYIRALQKGTQLYSSLDSIWRHTNTYEGAISAVSNALTQEHFEMSTKNFEGINVMTIHKAKGKEFDEVIIYEGLYNGRIVPKMELIEQARINLRVAVTRAKRRATILTPNTDPCPLL